MYQALYRKYRPQTFDDVVGQQAVTQTIKNQILSGKLSHAYLFTGSRGTGKTSSAKILAKAVNCENPQGGNPCNCCNACRAIDSGSCMDVLEIDAASNNGVDNVRDLRDDAVYTPSQVKMRVYIIDEVHMLSISAFNALLKIIEEPPEHLLFILATTELHKVPSTILSRCQRFSFRRISQEDIAARLQYVAYQENIELDDSAARVLARLADGGMRDGLSLLDQCASATNGDLTADRVYACLGIAGIQQCGQLMGYIAEHNSAKALSLFNRFYSEGKDLGALMDELACLTRDLMIMKTAPKEGISMLSGVATDQEIRNLIDCFTPGELVRMMGIIQQTVSGFTRSSSRRVDAELCIVNLCQPELSLDAEALNSRLTRVEEQLRSGSFQVAPPAAAKTLEEEEELPPPPAVLGPLFGAGFSVVTGLAYQALYREAEVQRRDAEELRRTRAELAAAQPPVNEAPVGFWTDIVSQAKKELKPPVSGFFTTTPNAPVQGVMRDGKLILLCENQFIVDIINKPEVLELFSRKASAALGQPVRAVAMDRNARQNNSKHLDELLSFGRANSGIINIKES